MKIKHNSGFTLIELMIVVAIIAIIAAIAIPSLMRSRMQANEANALGSLRAITTGQISFQAAAYDPGFGGVGNFGDLNQLADPDGMGTGGFIDDTLASGAKQGYNFVMVTVDGAAGAPPSFDCNADPQVPGQTGNRFFFVDQTGVIRFENGGQAGPASDPVQ